jgi:hypothetical protein
MKRLLVLAMLAAPVSAQSPRDSAHVAESRISIDSSRAALPSLNNFCATKTARSYPTMCRWVGVLDRRVPMLAAAESLLLVTTATPPAPTPAPSDAELPRVFLNTAMSATPATGRVLMVTGTLQAAMDTACAGDRIVARPGTTFRANMIYGPRSCGIAGQWIYVQAESLPPEGVRVDSIIARRYRFPKLISPNVNNTLVSAPGAQRWRFIGLEITVDTSVKLNYGTILAGDASAEQNTLAKVPTDIIFDRDYVHGHPTLSMVKCIALNSARSAVIDSYVSDCHSSFDAQAITISNGPGPFKIVNNYLEGSGETLMFGGADPGIPNLVPSDIEVRRNYITRQMAWRGKWLEKELVESKNSSHVLFEANVLENTWPDGQYGWILGLWSVNQNGTCTWCVTEHWTVRNNLARNVTSGFSLSGKSETPSPLAHHITITNNVAIGIDNPAIQGYGRVFQIFNVPNLRIEHNTAFTPNEPTFSYDAALMPNHIVRNNLTGGGMYQINSGYGQGLVAWQGVAGAGSVFEGNVVALFDRTPIPNNFYPATLDEIGLVGGATAAYSVSATLEQMALAATSPFKGKATDGKDPGADIAAVAAAIAGVKP